MSVSVETIFTLACIINFRKFGFDKRRETVTETTGRESDRGDLTDWSAGAPNENIVQNHINIALLNVL